MLLVLPFLIIWLLEASATESDVLFFSAEKSISDGTGSKSEYYNMQLLAAVASV